MRRAWAGESITTYIQEAMAEAPVELEFNEAKFILTKEDTADTAYEKWDAQMKANGEAYRKSPEGIAAAKKHREWEKREQEKRERVASMTLSPITIKPELADEYAAYVEMNSKDGYSKGVVDFGERWAALMEIGISQLNDRSDPALTRYFVDHAGDLSNEADTEGLTGFMYGCAVKALAHFWVHGEPLRRWHNREYMDEEKAARADASGGVVNPAILTIGE